MAMDREIKQQWVEALRSGEYQQGKSALRQGNAYCCLGVLCEVMQLDRRGPLFGGGPDVYVYIYGGVSHSTGLVPELREKVRILQDQMVELMDMNDCRGKTFPEIADWIEENL